MRPEAAVCTGRATRSRSAARLPGRRGLLLALLLQAFVGIPGTTAIAPLASLSTTGAAGRLLVVAARRPLPRCVQRQDALAAFVAPAAASHRARRYAVRGPGRGYHEAAGRAATAATAAFSSSSSVAGAGPARPKLHQHPPPQRHQQQRQYQHQQVELTPRERAFLQIAEFFPPEQKDNSTAFFHSPGDFETFAEAVSVALNLPMERAVKLHEIGAIYAHRGGRFRRTRNLESGDFAGPATVVEGETIRVHLFPRRFPACHGVDYRSRIMYEDEGLVVIDKPAGVPCSMHVSNALEVLDMAVSAHLGLDLIRMNRLDTVTSGLVTLAKTPEAAAAYWEELRRERVGKVYKALLDGPVALGLHEHYMPKDIIHRRPAPRAIGKLPLPNWKLCQSRVLSCTPLVLPEMDPARPDHVYWEVEAELITGRTHQLRATFAAEGSPIVRDTMYEPLRSFLLHDEDDPAIQAIYPLCAEPTAPTGIGLQCAGLTFLGRTVKAGLPWWRRQEQPPRS